MSNVTPTENWQSITLTKNEIWVSENGPFKLFCFDDVTPTLATQGWTIKQNASVTLVAAQTVYYRSARGLENKNISFVRFEVGL